VRVVANRQHRAGGARSVGETACGAVALAEKGSHSVFKDVKVSDARIGNGAKCRRRFDPGHVHQISSPIFLQIHLVG
jgi:hypothetical protein